MLSVFETMADRNKEPPKSLLVDRGANKPAHVQDEPSLKRQRVIQPSPTCTGPKLSTIHDQPTVVATSRKKLRGQRRNKSQLTTTEGKNEIGMDVEFTEVIHEARQQLQVIGNQQMTKELKNMSHSVEQSRSLQSLHSSKVQLFLVADTNVFIADVKFLNDLKDKDIVNFDRPHIVIPWVVVQELDQLKDSKVVQELDHLKDSTEHSANKESSKLKLKLKARTAVKYLSQWLESSHPQVIAQTPSESLVKRTDFTVETNDDRILQCCLQFADEYAESRVMLLTLDRNLRNKALIMRIPSYTIESLNHWLSTQACLSSVQRSQDCSESIEPCAKLRSVCNAHSGQKTCEGSALGRVVENNCRTSLNVTSLLEVSVESSSQPPSTSKNSSNFSRRHRRRKQNCPPSSVTPAVGCQQFQVNTVELGAVPQKTQDQATDTHTTPVNNTAPFVLRRKSTPCSVSPNPLNVSSTKCQLSVSLHSSASKRSVANSTRELVTSLLRNVKGKMEKSFSPNSILPDNRNQVLSTKVERAADSALTPSDKTVVGRGSKLVHASSTGVTVVPSGTSNVVLCSPQETRCDSSARGITSGGSTFSVNCHSTTLVSKQSKVEHSKKVQLPGPCISINSDDPHSKAVTALGAIRTCLLQGLSEIIEREMKAIYDDLWLQIIIQKPPWTLEGALECLNKHWIAVFGFVWPRHVQNTVKEMLTPTSFSTFTMNAKLLSSSIHETVGSDREMRNYSSVRSKLVSRIEEIELIYKQQKQCNAAATSSQVKTTYGVPRASQPGADTNDMYNSPYVLHSSEPLASRMECQNDISSESVLAPDRYVCIQQLFQTTWEGIYRFEKIYQKELASASDVPTRTAVLEAFVKFCQSLAAINSSYTSALEPSPSDDVFHQLSFALDYTAKLNKFQIQPFTSAELRNFFTDGRNRQMLIVGQQQMQSMMSSISEVSAQLLTPLEIQMVKSHL